MKPQVIIILFLPFPSPDHADEGMWMLTDLKQQNAAVMQDLGLDPALIGL